MDQVRHEKLTILFHHAVEYQFLKKLSKWLISVSVFSLLFSHSPLLPLLHSYNFYFSTFPFQLFSHTIDKNCIFLLCNGLLVFVAKYSGLIRSLSGSSQNDETFKYNEYDTRSESLVLEFKEPSLEMQVLVGKAEFQEHEAVDEVTQNAYSIEPEEKIQTSTSSEEDSVPEEGSSPINLREEEVAVSEEETHQIFYIEDEEEEGEEEEEEESFVNEENVEDKEVLVEEQVLPLSTEELNKKFDEFIRRMKEDLRLEARRQLVIV